MGMTPVPWDSSAMCQVTPKTFVSALQKKKNGKRSFFFFFYEMGERGTQIYISFPVPKRWVSILQCHTTLSLPHSQCFPSPADIKADAIIFLRSLLRPQINRAIGPCAHKWSNCFVVDCVWCGNECLCVLYIAPNRHVHLILRLKHSSLLLEYLWNSVLSPMQIEKH